MLVLMWLQLVIRWLLPRFRFDQIQKLCWKILLPTALANIFVTGAAALLDPSLELLAWIGLAEIVVIGLVTAAAGRAGTDEAHAGATHAEPVSGH
jgi:NADH-quinone oxidoreductase subunit H